GAVRPPAPRPHRRRLHRARRRLRRRAHLRRQRRLLRADDADRLPAPRLEGGRHRHPPRGRAPLGGRDRPLRRRQRRPLDRRLAAARVDPRDPGLEQARDPRARPRAPARPRRRAPLLGDRACPEGGLRHRRRRHGDRRPARPRGQAPGEAPRVAHRAGASGRDGEAAMSASPFASDFGPFDGRVWLNAAHQGPLPRAAVEALEAAVAPRTGVFCTSWVYTFTGHLADLAGLGRACRDHGVTFVVNATQALGRRPLGVSELPLDALACAGYKWLCGPYATGFAWFHPRLVESLTPRQAYWLAMPDDADLDLNDEGDYELRDDLGARAFDVFGTANFFDYMPWQASVEYLVDRGVERAAKHTDGLVRRLVEGLDDAGYRIEGPAEDPRLSIAVA